MVDRPGVTGQHVLLWSDIHGESLFFGGRSQSLDAAGVGQQGVHIDPNASESP
jgi:hypothetical protein